MLGHKWAQRRRAKRQAEKVLSDARMAADAARKALRDSRLAGGGRPPGDEELVDAVQAAILGSILPVVNDAGNRKRGQNRRGGSGLFILFVGMGIGVGLAAWARREDDEGAGTTEDEEWELAGGSSSRVVKTAINEALDKADVAIRRVAQATAQTMGSAIGSVADAASPTAELVTDKLRVARNRATEEVIRTLDGMEDVWGDESEDGDKPVAPTPKKPTPKKPTPRKPVEGKPVEAKPGSGRRRQTKDN